MRVLIVGYGKMGQLVDQLARESGHQIAARVDLGTAEWPAEADVAVDFSTAGALAGNFPHYLERRLPVVIGTTGWNDRVEEYRAAAGRAGIGVVASANFSIGVNLFELIVREAARAMAAHPKYGAWIHEAHHASKRDAPSGTALMLHDAMKQAGFSRPVDVSSTRAGAIPGIHTVGFDAVSDTIELTHTARDRRGFAAGAIMAAEFVIGRRGWFTMKDVLSAADARGIEH